MSGSGAISLSLSGTDNCDGDRVGLGARAGLIRGCHVQFRDRGKRLREKMSKNGERRQGESVPSMHDNHNTLGGSYHTEPPFVSSVYSDSIQIRSIWKSYVEAQSIIFHRAGSIGPITCKMAWRGSLR